MKKFHAHYRIQHAPHSLALSLSQLTVANWHICSYIIGHLVVQSSPGEGESESWSRLRGMAFDVREFGSGKRPKSVRLFPFFLLSLQRAREGEIMNL